MGRKKDDELERLEQTVREQKSVIRTLMKRVKKLNRGYGKERESTKKEKDKSERDDALQAPAKQLCPDCGRGEVVERVVLDRRWLECTACDRRTRTKTIPGSES